MMQISDYKSLSMATTYKSTIERAKIIQQLTAAYYEPGNLRRCYRAVWKKYINPVYPMCYNSFLKYLRMDTSTCE